MPAPALPIRGIHHIEFLAGNAKQAEHYYRTTWGFSRIGYLGPETGVRTHVSYAMAQNDIRFVLTTPLTPEDARTEWLARHGDGIVDVAFIVDDVDEAYHEAVKRGAPGVAAPHDRSDDFGTVRIATVGTYGDVVHSFVDARRYTGTFLPGFRKNERIVPGVGLRAVDHAVGNVEDGKMNDWVAFYERVFGFNRYVSFDDKDISTQYTALRSQVMASPDPERVIKMPINEPADGLKKSQIQEYIEANRGPGVQHLALRTDDILHTISALRAAGIEFLHVPQTYYDDVWTRVGVIGEDREAVNKLGILVDRDEHGYLLQLFSKPLQDRPTLFFEVIQRHGCQSFGKGNFKALFESIEREQALRGNL